VWWSPHATWATGSLSPTASGQQFSFFSWPSPSWPNTPRPHAKSSPPGSVTATVWFRPHASSEMPSRVAAAELPGGRHTAPNDADGDRTPLPSWPLSLYPAARRAPPPAATTLWAKPQATAWTWTSSRPLQARGAWTAKRLQSVSASASSVGEPLSPPVAAVSPDWPVHELLR